MKSSFSQLSPAEAVQCPDARPRDACLETLVLTPPPTDDRPPEQTYLEHLPLIEKIARRAGRRYGLAPEGVEDFVQEVQVKLIEDDYRRIRSFRGSSSFKTYLVTVVNRLAKDHCNHLWGKWRPSAAAKRLGWEARLLERLLYREGFSFEEAAEKMRRDHRVETSIEGLAELAGKIPQRTSRYFEGEEALENRPASPTPGERVDRRLADREKAELARKVEDALQKALDELDTEDRLILKLYFRGWTMARIARSLGLEQKPLYRRRDRNLARLRQSLEQRELQWRGVQRVLGWERLDLRLVDEPDLPDPEGDEDEDDDPG